MGLPKYQANPVRHYQKTIKRSKSKARMIGAVDTVLIFWRADATVRLSPLTSASVRLDSAPFFGSNEKLNYAEHQVS
jgi:hypothetical protein